MWLPIGQHSRTLPSTAHLCCSISILPPGAARPVVLVIHGGAWRAGNRTEGWRLNPQLARRGYNVVAIEYRFAPEHPFPAALHDVSRAIAWIKANATMLDVDASRIVLFGRSAGGHLALLAAYTLNDPSIRGASSYFGPTDLRWGWNNPASPRVIDFREMLSEFLGGTLDERGTTFDQASPVHFTNTAVPTLLVHGEMDETGVQRARGTPCWIARAERRAARICQAAVGDARM